MTFTALAIFTPDTTSQSVLGVRYLCVIEEDPANRAFTLRVLDPHRQNKEVSSSILKCHPSGLASEARARVQAMHPGREFTLPPFAPWDEWHKLVEPAA